MLHDAGLDPTKIDDPVLRRAVELAGHIASGDADAARQLVAHSMMAKEDETHYADGALPIGRPATLHRMDSQVFSASWKSNKVLVLHTLDTSCHQYCNSVPAACL